MSSHAVNQSDHRGSYHVAASHHLGRPAMRRVAEQVARLRQQGFRALPLPNLLCEVDGLYLYRFTIDGYIDTVVIRAEDCAVATRVPDTFDPAVPLCERHSVWSENGDLTDVVGELMRFSPVASSNRIAPQFSGELDIARESERSNDRPTARSSHPYGRSAF